MAKPSTIINVVALAFGAVVLAVMIHETGWAVLREGVVRVGRWFAVIAAIDVASVFCDSFALHGFLRPHARVSYWRVFAAEFSGLAINRVSPANTLGEPVKVTMLVRSVSTEQAVSGVMSFNLTTIYVALATFVIGVPISVALLDLSSRVAAFVWITLVVLIAGGVALALLIRRGPFGTLIGLLARVGALGTERQARWRDKTAGVDARLRALGGLRAEGLGRGVAGVVASRVLYSIGTVAVLYAAGIPLSAPLIVASLSIGILITWIANIVPLGLGVAEGGNYAMYALFAHGLAPAAGVVFAMINRLRTILLALVGLVVMAIANLVHRRYHREP